jgi:outer membrane protein OmpA-like peptidoglycan-associated protein
LYVYKADSFNTKKGDDTVKVEVAGRYCRQSYTFKGTGDPMSVLEAQMNFHEQLNQLGAQIVYSSDNETDAKLSKDGKDTWIYVGNNGESYITVLVIQPQPFVATLTAPSGGDYHLIGHMPNYVVEDKPTKRNFDQATFTVKDGDDSRQVKAQGAYYEVSYDVKPKAQPSSILETQLNYRDALKKAGAQILFASDKETDARLDNKGQTVWVQVSNNGEMYITVTAIEEKAFQATIKPPQASALKAALDKDGHVALYVNFDFDKATLRPDAAPVLAQVTTLLKDNPDLKLSVEGNTDNVGAHDYNVKLSQDRAAAVVAALVKSGIAGDRLKSSGNGPDKPIADNDSTAGRAKNRRVELVKL